VSFFLFIDESGHDRCHAPYEVLAGVAIEDRELWNLIQRVHDLEEEHFGMRITDGPLELKGKKLLKSKTFRLASQSPAFPPLVRRDLAYTCLLKGSDVTGSHVTQQELAALGQAKIAFVTGLLELCSLHRVRAFACIVDRDAERTGRNDILRKDYAFLFERFFYFLEDRGGEPMGSIVFDELEKSRCHILLNQMEKYFLQTSKGRMRSARIIPEPFFVHSELTSAIQIADVIAYIISWGVRIGSMQRPRREELGKLAELVCQLRYKAVREMMGKESFVVWSFAGSVP